MQEFACPYWVRSWPHSAHKPFITMGWLHCSILTITPLKRDEKKNNHQFYNNKLITKYKRCWEILTLVRKFFSNNKPPVFVFSC